MPEREGQYRPSLIEPQLSLLRDDDVMVANAFLGLHKAEHQRAFDRFRMDESSFKLQVFICVLRTLSIQRELMNTLPVVLLRLGSILCLFFYTIRLAEYKNLIRYCGMTLKVCPILVCNVGMILSVVSTSIQLLEVAVGAEDDDDLPVYEIILILSQIMFARIFFRMGDWWASAAVGIVGGGSVAAAGAMYDLSFPTIMLGIFSGVMSILLAYEYDMNKLTLFINYSNLDHVVRNKLEVETKKRHAEQLSSELRSFIGNVAHDLKTPLQAFVSELEILEKCTDRRTRASCIAALNSTCSFMSMMINRSLDFVKSESGVPLAATMSTVDLEATLSWVTNCIRRVSNKVPIRVFDMASSVCRYIITDKQWLNENLLCLTSNAIKFTTSGSIDISIAIVTELYIQGMKQDDASKMVLPPGLPTAHRKVSPMAQSGTDAPQILLFEIEDTGIGLSDEQQKCLFKPFQQAQRKAGGTGLGLYALAKRIEAAGGQYGVKGRHDGRPGSLFWFAIPYRPDVMTASLITSLSDDRIELQNMDEETEDGTRSHKNSFDDVFEAVDLDPNVTRVLLVDDSPIIQKTTRRALQREGYSVIVAANGVECLDLLAAQNPFDVILLDMQMPVMDGLETIRRIREKEKMAGSSQKPLFVIGVSANSDKESGDDAISAGMNDFISKPLSMAALKKCCRDHGVII